MFVLEKIGEYAKTDRIALINREESLTYAELDELGCVCRLALERFETTGRPW